MKWLTPSFEELALQGLKEPGQEQSVAQKGKTPVQCDPQQPCTAAAILYNKKAWDYIERNRLNNATVLAKLAPKVDSTSTASVNFPVGSIIVKTLWEVVNPTRSRAQVWDSGATLSANASLGGPAGWSSATFGIGIDTTVKGCPSRNYQIGAKVPIGCFQSIQVTSGNVSLIDAGATPGQEFSQGDYIILLGLHIIEKVRVNGVPRWSWSTFWWTNNPGGYDGQHPDYNSDRPKTISSQWDHYVMNDTLNDSQSPVFNPYIEGPDAKTASLNCINCHRYAIYPTKTPSEQNVAAGEGLSPQPEDGYFKGSFQTDYLWSLVFKRLQKGN